MFHHFSFSLGFGQGRAWLLMALNEASMESYIRFMSENVKVVKKFYTRYSLFRDPSRLEVGWRKERERER